jgi:hypothetical protein
MKWRLIVTVLRIWVCTKSQQALDAFDLHIEHCEVEGGALELVPEIVVEVELVLIEILNRKHSPLKLCSTVQYTKPVGCQCIRICLEVLK